MVKIDGLRNARHLVNIAQETVQIQVVTDAVLIALEVGNIHRIKAYQRGPQANVGLGQLVTGQIAMLTQNLLQSRQ
ncbi:hypothetical protein D3C81_2291300 [compost metagenome]